MDRELLIDEVMMVLPALMRGMVRPSSVELGRRKRLANTHVSPGHEHGHAHVSPGHIQLVMKAKVHPADLADRDGAAMLLDGFAEAFPRLSHLWADAGYRGTAPREWLTEGLGLTLEIVQRRRRWRWVPPGAEPPLLPAGFEVIRGGGWWRGRSPGSAATAG